LTELPLWAFAVVLLVVELVVEIINVFFLLISLNPGATFEPLVSGLALRAALVPFLALVLVARAADREGALVAGNEDIAGGRDPDGVPAYLADSRSFWLLTRRGRVAVVANRDELVAVVRARDHPRVGRHVAPPSDAGDGGREREGESAREAP
jgi:hypothetical protein